MTARFLAEILGLAQSIRELSQASRKMRTSMWSALQATILFAQNPEMASGERLPADEAATSGPKPETEDDSNKQLPAEKSA
jgi:hypothetical protein